MFIMSLAHKCCGCCGSLCCCCTCAVILCQIFSVIFSLLLPCAAPPFSHPFPLYRETSINMQRTHRHIYKCVNTNVHIMLGPLCRGLQLQLLLLPPATRSPLSASRILWQALAKGHQLATRPCTMSWRRVDCQLASKNPLTHLFCLAQQQEQPHVGKEQEAQRGFSKDRGLSAV